MHVYAYLGVDTCTCVSCMPESAVCKKKKKQVNRTYIVWDILYFW